MNKLTRHKNRYREKTRTKTQKRKPRRGGSDVCDLDSYIYDQFQVNPIGKYYNQYHSACIYNNLVYYITPKYVIRPNIQSIITSKFSFIFPNQPDNIVSRKVMIENRYVSYIVIIQNEWYVIMRDILKGVFPAHLQRGFFKLSPNIIKRHTNGLLEILNSECYEEYASDTIKLKDAYVEHITIDKDAIKCRMKIPSPYFCSYENHPVEKRKPTDKIYMMLDILRYFHTRRSLM